MFGHIDSSGNQTLPLSKYGVTEFKRVSLLSPFGSNPMVKMARGLYMLLVMEVIVIL